MAMDTSDDPYTTFPQIQEFEDARHRIAQFIHKTSVFTCRQADERSGRRLYFKAENQQKAGSAKARGALNAVLKTLERKPDLKGVVTISTGNHGQAIAWACQQMGVPGHVVVFENTPQPKKDAIRGYGATLVECPNIDSEGHEVLVKLQKEKDLEFIPSYDHRDVVAGQGSVAIEFLSDVPELDAILVSVCGGGLAAGIATAAKHIKPGIKVFLVTPKGKQMEECLRSGKRPWSGPTRHMDTIADSLRYQPTGLLATPTLIRLVEKDVFEMSDEDMVQGMKFSFERMKLVIEAAAGATVAAAFSDKLRAMDPDMKHVGILLCGGNLDIDNLPW